MAQRSYDLVLYGATGFTGRQAAVYLAEHAPEGLRWAIAGRSREKLAALAKEVSAPAIEVADSADPVSVEALVSQARVVASTAGPFALYSEPVVAACVRHCADYVDLTGEAPWIRSLIDRFHDQAAAQGTRIIPCCGVDSVPSDLGTQAAVRWLREQLGQPTRTVSASFVFHSSGLNGGTLATALEMAEAGQENSRQDVLLLNPPGRTSPEERARSAEVEQVRYDPLRGAWLGPFIMAPINSRVVRRSNGLFALAGEAYGPEFSYQETAESRSGWAARKAALDLKIGGKVLESKVGRALVRRFGPKPGEGPSEETMRRGSVRARFVAEAQDGRQALATLSAPGDAANRVTVPCLCEAALALIEDRDKLPGGQGRGGILTPAFGLGEVLFERLRRAGFQWEIGPVEARG